MSYSYPTSYKPKSLEAQAKILKKYFKGLKLPEVPDSVLHSTDGEALFLIPHWRLLGTYQEACEKAWQWLSESRKTYKYLDFSQVRQTEKKAKMWETAPDVLVLPCQLGHKYAGISIREARESFGESEVGLGAYEAFIVTLTHPERFEKWDELDMDLAGDEVKLGDDAGFDYSAFLGFYDGRVRFGYRYLDDPRDDFGSASGFVPQTLSNLAPRNLEAFGSLSEDTCLRQAVGTGIECKKTHN